MFLTLFGFYLLILVQCEHGMENQNIPKLASQHYSKDMLSDRQSNQEDQDHLTSTDDNSLTDIVKKLKQQLKERDERIGEYKERCRRYSALGKLL